MSFPVRAKPLITPMRRGRLPGILLPPRPRGSPRKTERPQRFPQRDHPIKHHVAGPESQPEGRGPK